MKNLRAQQDKGFTLIELLLVVAIIGLLSAIVLTAMDTSREKARNSKRNSMALEYINALELYRSDSDSGEYPDVGDSTMFDMYCIGDWDTSCWGSLPDGSSNGLNDALEKYIPGPPKNDAPIISSGTDYSGTLYGCYYGSGTKCTEYEIWWILEGNPSEVKCVRGTNANNLGGLAWCKHKSYEE